MTWLHGRWWLTSAALLCFLVVAACEEQGPAERMGRAIDESAAEAGEAIEGAADRLRDAVN